MLRPGLLPIIDLTVCRMPLFELVETLLDNDISQFILRSRGFSKEEYKECVARLDDLKTGFEFDYLLHRHVDLLDDCQAAGVHLPSKGRNIAEVRAQLGTDVVLGCSVHGLEEAIFAEESGADYVVLGAIFDTPKDHDNHPILGLDELADTCEELEIPVFAVGGITPENLISVQDTGTYGFSALRALFAGGDLDHNLSKLVWIWEQTP